MHRPDGCLGDLDRSGSFLNYNTLVAVTIRLQFELEMKCGNACLRNFAIYLRMTY